MNVFICLESPERTTSTIKKVTTSKDEAMAWLETDRNDHQVFEWTVDGEEVRSWWYRHRYLSGEWELVIYEGLERIQ